METGRPFDFALTQNVKRLLMILHSDYWTGNEAGICPASALTRLANPDPFNCRSIAYASREELHLQHSIGDRNLSRLRRVRLELLVSSQLQDQSHGNLSIS
jgi:hypothetical protein